MNDDTKEIFPDLASAAAHCKREGCPFAWITAHNGGFRVVRPAPKTKAASKKKAAPKKKAPPRQAAARSIEQLQEDLLFAALAEESMGHRSGAATLRRLRDRLEGLDPMYEQVEPRGPVISHAIRALAQIAARTTGAAKKKAALTSATGPKAKNGNGGTPTTKAAFLAEQRRKGASEAQALSRWAFKQRQKG